MCEAADYGNICMQGRPGSRRFLDYNNRSCETSDLALAVVDTWAYGTLSHSHLHQCLKNLCAGAPAKVPVSFIVARRLSTGVSDACRLASANSATTSLAWAISSHKVRVVFGAMEVIPGAADRRATLAMKERATQAFA